MRRFLTVLLVVAAAASLPVQPAAAVGPSTAPYELSPSLLPSGLVDGSIVDLSTTSTLYLASAVPSLLVLVSDAGYSTLPEIPGRQHEYGWITERGALFTTVGGDPVTRHLWEYNIGDEPIDLGPIGLDDDPVVRGSYAVWNTSDGSLYRRDLIADATVTVASSASSAGDVTETGDVVYGAYEADPHPGPGSYGTYVVRRYHDGATEQLTPTELQTSSYPVTDGVNVVYEKGPALGSWDQNWGVWFYDGATQAGLTVPSFGHSGPGAGYDVAGGWIAFYGWSEQGRQIWVRSPAGVVTQVSNLDGLEAPDAAQIVAVNDQGETMYAVGDTLYLGAVGQAPRKLARGVGAWASKRLDEPVNSAEYLDGTWVLGIGNSRYELSDQPLHTIHVHVHGSGTVGISPYGATCRGDCEFGFLDEAILVLSGTGDLPGWRFDRWDGICAGNPQQDACWTYAAQVGDVTAVFGPADTTAPIAAAPVTSFVAGTLVAVRYPPAVPVRTSWTAADREGSEISQQELEVSVNGGEFASVPLPTMNAQSGWLTATANSWVTYQFRARAVDVSPNYGEWTVGAPFTLQTLGPDSMSYTGNWTYSDSATSFSGRTAWTMDDQATATFWAGGQAVAIIARTDANLGELQVYVDGQLRQVAPTAYEGPSGNRVVATVPLGGGWHTVRVQVDSYPPHPIELQAAVVMGPAGPDTLP